MSVSINSLLGSEYVGYASLADFQANLRAVEEPPVAANDVPVAEANPEQMKARQHVASEIQADRSMSRYVDSPNGILSHQEMFSRTDELVRRYKLRNGSRPPEDVKANDFDTVNEIATSVFGAARDKGGSVIDEKATLLAKMLEAKVLSALPRKEGEPEPCLSASRKSELADFCKLALGKMLKTSLVRSKFVKNPNVFEAAPVVKFRQQQLQLELDAIAREKKEGLLSGDSLRQRLAKATERLNAVFSEGMSFASDSLKEALNDSQRLLQVQLSSLKLFGTRDDRQGRVQVDDDVRNFGDYVLNGALGFAELLQKGAVSEDALVSLADSGAVYSLENTADVVKMQYRAMQDAKEKFVQEKKFAAFLSLVETKYGAKSEAFAQIRKAVLDIVNTRRQFTRVLDFEPKLRFVEVRQKDGSVVRKPDEKFLQEQLADMRERMTQFRFDLQWHAGQVGIEDGKGKFSYAGILERIRRRLSNTFAHDKHADQRFTDTKVAAARFAEMRQLEKSNYSLLKAFDAFCSGATPDVESVFRPVVDFDAKSAESRFQRRIYTAAQVTHTTNWAVRNHEAVGAGARAWTQYAHDVLDELGDGGTRSFVTKMSVSVLAQAGVPGLGGAKLSAGVFRNASVSLSHSKDGVYTINILTKYGGRVDAKGGVAGDKVKVDAGVEFEAGEGAKLTFTTREELLAFLRENAPELLREVPGAMTFAKRPGAENARLLAPVALEKASLLRKIGKGLASRLKFRIHREKNFSEVAFNARMNRLGAFDSLTKIEYRHRNALAQTLQQRVVVGGGVDASVSVGGSESTVGNVKTVKGPSLKAKAKLAAHGNVSVQNFRLMSAKDRFKYFSCKDMLDCIFDKEMARFESFATEFGHGLLSTAASRRTLRDNVQAARRSFARFADSCAAALHQTALKDRIGKLRAGFDDFRQEVERYNQLTGENALAIQDDEQRQILYALTLRAYAVANETFAKAAEELRALPGADVAVKAEADALANEARKLLAPVLQRPEIPLSGTIMQRFAMFSTLQKGSDSLDVDFQGSVSWDAFPPSTESKVNQGPSTPAERLKDFFGKDLPAKALSNLADLGKRIGFAKVGGSFSIAYKRPLHDDPTQSPWTQHGSLTLSLKVDVPVNYFTFMVTAFKALTVTADKLKADPKSSEEDIQSADTALKGLAEQLANMPVTEADTLADTAITGLFAALVSGGPSKSGGLGLSLASKVSYDTALKANFTFTDGIFTSCSLVDAFKRNAETKVGLSMPFAGIGVEFSYGTEDGIERSMAEFIHAPPVTFFLGRCAGLAPAAGETRQSTMSAFLRRHQYSVDETMKDLRSLDEIKAVGPDAKGGTLSGVHTSRTKRFRQIANVRRDMEKLRLIAGSNSPIVTKEMKAEAQRHYDNLFARAHDPSDEKDGIWNRILAKPSATEKDGDRVELLSEFADKVTAAYSFINKAGDLVKAYGSLNDLNLSNTGDMLAKAYESAKMADFGKIG